MGFSVSASTAIIFAGMFLALGMLYPTMSNSYERVSDAQFDRDDSAIDARNTAIEIDTVTEDSVTVNNTGSTALTVSTVDVVIDGVYQPRDGLTYTVNGAPGSDLWLPGETLTVSNFTASNRVVVVTEHGIRATGAVN